MSTQIAEPSFLSQTSSVRDRLLRLDQVKEIVGLGKTLIYRMVSDGEFPVPYKPGGSATRWSENEILGWLSSCAKQRQQQVAR